MNKSTESPKARAEVVVAFVAILILALTVAIFWYYLQGRKTDKAPSAPKSSLECLTRTA
jgi:hypothetical protein